jgi:hypothetical protein
MQHLVQDSQNKEVNFMNKREDTIQKFSTFLSFGDGGRYLFWQTDSRLERQIRCMAKSSLETQADFWARYFLKIAQGVSPIQESKIFFSIPSSTTAGKHLSAYLQEACLWTAQKLYCKFTFLRHKYSLEEYFQIGNSVATPPTKILKNFNFEYSQTNIEGYARTAIIRAVQNQIYQQDVEAKRTKFSDYGLLKDLSNKELTECLGSAAINQEKISSYRLVWQCFDEIYQPSDGLCGRSLPVPNQEQLEEIAFCYNQRCSQLDVNAKLVSAGKIQEILTTCIQLAREYRTKRFLPLEDKYDNVTDFKPSLLDIVIEQEERNDVYLLVSKLFAEISDTGQIILTLWLGLNLTQAEIAMVLKNKYPDLQKQYQVARFLGKISKSLLSNFIQDWNQTNPENLINDENNLEVIKESLMDCLQLYCHHKILSLLEKVKNKICVQEKELVSKISPDGNQNTKKKNLSESALKSSEILQINLQRELESSMHLDANSFLSARHKLADFMEKCW